MPNDTIETLVAKAIAREPETVSICNHPATECGLCDDINYRGPTCIGANPRRAALVQAWELLLLHRRGPSGAGSGSEG